MSYRYRLLFLFVMLLIAPEAPAQTGGVRGFVVDASDGQPLQGVNLVLLRDGVLAAGAASDGDGYFILPRQPAGTYLLRATFVGYTPYEETLTLRAGTMQTLRLRLAPRETAIDEVVVEAEQASGAISTAGLQTIRAADLDRIPMPGVTGDLVGQLRAAPSVISVGDRGGQLFIRGGEPTQNLILLDGIPLYQPFHILSFYSAFPAEIVNYADVYAGGFGASYGGRLSSVIDVAARNGNKERFEGGVSVAPFLSTLRLEGPLIKGRVSGLVSVRQSLVEEALPNLYGQKLPYRFGDQFAKIHAQPTRGSSFSITAIRTTDRGDIAGTKKTLLGDFDREAIADSNEVAWENVGLGTRLLILPGRLPVLAELTASYSRLDTELGLPEDPEREAAVEGYDAEASFSYLMRGRAAKLGFFARQTTLSYALGGLFQEVPNVEETTMREAGAYLELDLPFASGLRLTPGLRLHAFPDQQYMGVEPRLRAGYTFDGAAGAQQVSLAAGLYHQGIVGLTDERDAGNVFTAWTASPEDDDVPRALHFIGGWQTRYPVDEETNLQVSVEGYHKVLQNLFVPRWEAFPQFTTTLQKADGRVNGLDARLEVTHPVFYGYLGYGLSKTMYLSQDDVFGTFYGEEQDRYHPPHDRRRQVNAVAQVFVGPVTLSAQWQYGSGLPYTRALGFDDWLYLGGLDVDLRKEVGQYRVLYEAPYSARLPEYHRLDLWLERSFEKGRLSGMLRTGVVNLYNRDNLFYFDLFTLKRVDQLPAIPSIGLKLEIQ